MAALYSSRLLGSRLASALRSSSSVISSRWFPSVYRPSVVPVLSSMSSSSGPESTGSFKDGAERVSSFIGNVWTEFTGLSIKHNTVNLGQGFPNFPPPTFAREAGVSAVTSDNYSINQYARSPGHLRLTKALANWYGPILGRQLDPISEIHISNGASGVLFNIAISFLNPLDEIIVMEPFFDLYTAQAKMAGAVCKFVPLRAPPGAKLASEFVLRREDLEAAVSKKTKAIIICNPHNPTGKVFSEDELRDIADFCIKHDIMAISDEVYESLVFDGLKQNRLASLPGMWERTLTVGSSGKTFSITGWKIGWAIGPSVLTDKLQRAHGYMTFSVCTPMQEAVAEMLEKAPSLGYYEELRNTYTRRRDRLMSILERAGMPPIKPQGQYFVLADTSSIDFPYDKYKGDPENPVTRDWAFCRWLTVEKGVTAIPPSAFYSDENKHLASSYARFAFCKSDEALDDAERRLVPSVASSAKSDTA